MIAAPRRLRSKEHLRFLASRPCLVCGRKPSDPHHIRFAQPRALGRKVSDEYAVPLCRSHHRDVHRYGNERVWWANARIDPLAAALRLWLETRGATGPQIVEPELGKAKPAQASGPDQQPNSPAHEAASDKRLRSQ